MHCPLGDWAALSPRGRDRPATLSPALCVGTICRGAWWDLQRPPDLCCADSLALLCPERPPGSEGTETFLLDVTSRLEPQVLGSQTRPRPENHWSPAWSPRVGLLNGPLQLMVRVRGSLVFPVDGEGRPSHSREDALAYAKIGLRRIGANLQRIRPSGNKGSPEG